MAKDIYDTSQYVRTTEGCEKGLLLIDVRNIEIVKELQALKDEQDLLTQTTSALEKALAYHNQGVAKLSPTQEYIQSQNKQRSERVKKVETARKILEGHGLEDVLSEEKVAKDKRLKVAVEKSKGLNKKPEEKKGEDGAL
jgi:hypothetical protein